MGKEKKQVEYTSEYELEGRIPLGRAILLGMQHVLAMFVGNLTPILIIGGMCGLADAGLMRPVLQNAMLIAGIVTLIQLWTIGPVGSRLPIVMGTSSGFIGVSKGIVASVLELIPLVEEIQMETLALFRIYLLVLWFWFLLFYSSTLQKE